jgi:hypothetical protein
MTPVQRAAAVYSREDCARSFKEDVEAHLLHGWVISTPEVFLLARKVDHAAPQDQIINPWFNSWEKEPDSWHLYLFSGSLMSAFKCAPYPLEYVSYERTNDLRIYKYDVIHRKCARFSSSFSTDFPLS